MRIGARVTVAVWLVLCTQAMAGQTAPQATRVTASVEPDVRYGWVSGLALLMDVYQPTPRSGHGIIVVPGNGWHTGTADDAAPHTEQVPRLAAMYLDQFLAAGYTVFVPNVRMAPVFQYPDPVVDLQRAVRFIRSGARRWGVDADRLGAFGVASGGHLAALVGVLDGDGRPDASDAVDQASAKVQAVATMAGAFDRTNPGGREGSPVTQVSPGDAPMLLIHGDADTVVPIAESQAMEQALTKAGVPTKLIAVAGGGHGGPIMEERRTELMQAVIAWFDQHLRDR